MQAAEQRGWTERKLAGCTNGLTTLQLETNCISHQAQLAKKPGLLQIDGLCSSMVRFARAMRSSKYQDLFAQGLETIAHNVDRREVAELPQSCVEWQERSRRVCDLFGNALSEDIVDELVTIFNGRWEDKFADDGCWLHFCCGCCQSEEDTIQRARECLRTVFQSFPQVPLLYRWKGWEACQEYVSMGVLLHGFLQFLVRRCCTNKTDKIDSLLEHDEDQADFSFAVKQEVRMTKTLSFITSPNIEVVGLQFANFDQ